jgi:serine/threonine protein kinase
MSVLRANSVRFLDGATTQLHSVQPTGQTIMRKPLESFEPVKMLGAGAFGAAFFVHDLRFDRRDSVLKLFIPAPSYRSVQAGSYLAEVNLLPRAGRKTAGVPRFFEKGEMFVGYVETTHPIFGDALERALANPELRREFETQGGFFLKYLLMEKLDGLTAHALSWRSRGLGLGPISEGEMLAYLHGMTKTVRDLGRIGHFDIKPENTFITINGLIKLLDFGIGRNLKSEKDYLEDWVDRGTTITMAPEAGRGSNCKASDIFSAAASALLVRYGETPIAKQTAEGAFESDAITRWRLANYQGTSREELSNLMPRYDGEISALDVGEYWNMVDLFVSMLNPNPNSRITADEVVRILENNFAWNLTIGYRSLRERVIKVIEESPDILPYIKNVSPTNVSPPPQFD